MITGNPNYWNLYATKGHNHDDMYAKVGHTHDNFIGNNFTIPMKYSHSHDWSTASPMAGKTYFGGWHGSTNLNGYISFGSSGAYTCDMFVDGDFYARESQKVYHQGFKPTPEEIGAIPSSASCNKNWHWNGQGGQPSWVWGGNDGHNMYVYNPSNFSVNWANGANYSNGSVSSEEWHSTGWGISYLRTGNGDNATWSTHNVILKTHWGLGVRDYRDECSFLIDARLGNVFAKGYMMATKFNTSSDRRLKENINPIDDKYEDFFMRLKPVNYNMINDNDSRLRTGFIAQEVEESMTECGITYDEFAGLEKTTHKNCNSEDIPKQILEDDSDVENTEYSLCYDEFIPLNTHMIQKQQKEIEILTNRVETLEQTINQLLHKVNSDL